MFDKLDNSLFICQFIFAICLFSGIFISYLIPVLIYRRGEHAKVQYLSWCKSVTSGALLGICFLDLLPKTRQLLNERTRSIRLLSKLSAGDSIIVLGTLLAMFCETMAIIIIDNTLTILVPKYYLGEKVKILKIRQCLIILIIRHREWPKSPGGRGIFEKFSARGGVFYRKFPILTGSRVF